MLVLSIVMLWSVTICIVFYRYSDCFNKEQELLDKYKLPITISQVALGVVLLKRLRIPYDQKIFKRFIRYGDIVFQKGCGKSLHYFVLAKQMTLFCLGLPIVISTLQLTFIVFLLSLLLLSLVIFNERYRIKQRYVQKQRHMAQQLSHVLFQFVLLVSAGYTIMECFEKVAMSKKGDLYDEMQMCIEDMKSGTSQTQALVSMANRCDDKAIKRMLNLLMQTQQKGSSEMGRLFFEMSQLNWQKQKVDVLKRAQTAATKLLLPSGIIFLGIILMMLLPLVVNGFLV